MNFFNRATTRFDVATAVVGALLAAFKAYDTTQKYKLEHSARNDKENNK